MSWLSRVSSSLSGRSCNQFGEWRGLSRITIHMGMLDFVEHRESGKFSAVSGEGLGGLSCDMHKRSLWLCMLKIPCMFTFQGVAEMQNNYVFNAKYNLSHNSSNHTHLLYIMLLSPDDLTECVLIKGFNKSPSLAQSLSLWNQGAKSVVRTY